MDILTIITSLIITSAAFSYLNQRFLRLPGTIGVMTISIVVSLFIILIGKTGFENSGLIKTLTYNIDFSKVLLDVMLGFLLFAMAMHFDYQDLKKLRAPVILLSTIGVIVSAGVFGGLFHLATVLLKVEVPLIYSFVFGALISPTDPIAVASILKQSRIPARLETIISGESMFNDAVGLILFVTLLSIADQSQESLSLMQSLVLFSEEVIGGIVIGLMAGYAGYRLMKSISDFQTIFLISVALVLGLSVIAGRFHASVPLSAVTAGLIIGNNRFGRSHPAEESLSMVWKLLDEVLNTILFVMIGLQLIMLPFFSNYLLIGCVSVVIVLFARMISISIPSIFILRRMNPSNLAILTWAGLRGGISVAMALLLPASPYREAILSCCYFIVIFSVIVQGLTLNRVVNKFADDKDLL
ncbi:cation:proton antiporter [Dyadobacter sediminis]|uniref:Sodium:proton antiporter n=1 Tax=Dyadobacter sediminis TaxID=1493691 RepID=A0A5R9KK81_9BACT|nr:sodium:proton antiporter [Dyadobacter sediminis]TLU96605.1 sodium:proton antiporter [Dyadobacter sediminis]GGB83670.1 sodium:proton antiporter [Dyadobacter sediminis]